PLGPAERGAAPVAPGDQLERAGGDFLARLGHADDHARAPAAVAAFERGAHDLGVAGAIEGVVRAAVGQLDHLGADLVAAHAFGVEELGHAELAAPFLARRIDVDADDPVGAGEARALDHVEADPAEAEHHDVVAHLDLGSVYHRPDARGHPAADVAAGLE